MRYRFYFFLVVLAFILSLTPIWAVSAKTPATAKIAFTSTRDGNSEIYIMNPDGSQQLNLTLHGARDLAPAWSPTGEYIAFNSDRDGTRDIYVMDADGKNVRKVFRRLAYREYPTWSPDGQRIAYLHADNWSIYVGTIDGKQEKRITWTNFLGGWPAWAPDTPEIAFIFTAGPGNYQLKVVNLETREERTLLPNGQQGVFLDPTWSPDGTHITFSWFQKGIYIMDSDGDDLKRLIPDASRPAWSPLGDQLVYGKQRQVFTFNLSNRRSTQLTQRTLNFGADWFDPQTLPVQPDATLLTNVWARIKQN